MPTEHSGGSPAYAFEEDDGSHSTATTVCDFNFVELDSTEDHLREAVLAGKPIAGIVKAMIEPEIENARREGALTALELVATNRNPKQFIKAALFACGSCSAIGQSGTAIAKDFGFTKQNFQQAVKRAAEKLGLAKNRTMRGDDARENMRQRNSRR